MAPSIANFHHVEIDNIGKRRRNLHPPGGESSDIFNFRKPTMISSQPRNVKFYNRSTIFAVESAPAISRATLVRSTDSKFSTKQRLFGPPDEVPRKAVDRMKSSIFSRDPLPESKPKGVHVKPDRRNPITGEECVVLRHVRRHQTEKRRSNPITGEGYDKHDEDSSITPSSSSSSHDTPCKGTCSDQPSSPGSHVSDKEDISSEANNAVVLYNLRDKTQ